MRTVDQKINSGATAQKEDRSFFSKATGGSFFGTSHKPAFFKTSNEGNSAIQKKCASCEHDEGLVQRQEQPDPPEKKPVSPDDTPGIPLGRKPRAAKCSTDPRFPDFGCFGQQLKLDLDENLINNAHQFNRVATLFPGDSKLMLDTFLRYGIGKNLLETSFEFAGFNKKWSNRLSYGTGIALKAYDLVQNGQLKLDVQLPIGNNMNLDIKLDLNINPTDRDKEKLNTVIGVSGSF